MQFLRASGDAYDAGYRDEAYRIAVAIRVLLHNTGQSVSLLRHLHAETVPLLATTMAASPGTGYYDGMSLLESNVAGGSVRPALETAHVRRIVSAQDWWTEDVYVLNQLRLARKDIVLRAANQDGGAHVDAKLNAEYAAFKSGIWTFSSTDPNAAHDIPEPQLVFLRQMAYELLNSAALNDLMQLGVVTPQNLVLTGPTLPSEPPAIEPQELHAMTIAEVDRLRDVVRKGHYTLLDGLSTPGVAINPLGNFEIDQQDGYAASLSQWIEALLHEGLIAESSPPGLYSGTPRGRAFVARIREIGH
jgi:hypothetical protein